MDGFGAGDAGVIRRLCMIADLPVVLAPNRGDEQEAGQRVELDSGFGYDMNRDLVAAQARGMTLAIPPKRSRKMRHCIKRVTRWKHRFCRLKEWRVFST